MIRIATSCRPGGAILYAVQEGEAVGTVALKYQGDGVYELTKMAVTRACQGQGLGRQLLRAAIARFREIAGSRLYLESSSRLGPALALYESAGFVMNPVQSRRTISVRTFIWSTADHRHQGLNSEYFPGKSRISALDRQRGSPCERRIQPCKKNFKKGVDGVRFARIMRGSLRDTVYLSGLPKDTCRRTRIVA